MTKPLLYHCPDTRSFRALWALEEVGIDYDLELLTFPPIFNDKAYLDENPLGTVPLYIDGDVRMRESVAICDWLGRKYGPAELVVDPGDPDYAAYLDTLFFGEASLSWPQGVALLYSEFMPEHLRQAQVAEDMRKRSRRLIADAEARLGDADHFVANRFTMADISMAYAFKISESIGIADALSDRMQSYLARVRQRPAYLRAKQRQAGATT